MYRKLLFSLCFVLFSVATAVALESAPPVSADPDAKLVRGMSVLGNNEAPMSLVIVPWKSSQLGVETNLNRTLSEHDVPVDRELTPPTCFPLWTPGSTRGRRPPSSWPRRKTLPAPRSFRGRCVSTPSTRAIPVRPTTRMRPSWRQAIPARNY